MSKQENTKVEEVKPPPTRLVKESNTEKPKNKKN